MVLVIGFAASGCFGKKSAKPRPESAPRAGAPPAESTAALRGDVSSVNAVARFVVLSFPLGRLPAVDQPLNLYRAGAKVGVVKATGQRRGKNVIADIVTGTPEVGDEARAD